MNPLVSLAGAGPYCPPPTPRLEQYIRAERAAEFGFATMLVDEGSCEPRTTDVT